MALVALCNVIESPRPVFHRTQLVGLSGPTQQMPEARTWSLAGAAAPHTRDMRRASSSSAGRSAGGSRCR
jgi:hypothetical protein